jgi:hypothetical protein
VSYYSKGQELVKAVATTEYRKPLTAESVLIYLWSLPLLLPVFQQLKEQITPAALTVYWERFERQWNAIEPVFDASMSPEATRQLQQHVLGIIRLLSAWVVGGLGPEPSEADLTNFESTLTWMGRGGIMRSMAVEDPFYQILVAELLDCQQEADRRLSVQEAG